MSDADADGTDELRDLIARARQDGPAPERLAAVRARLETRLGPLDPPTSSAPTIPGKLALGVVAVAAVIAIGVWLGTRTDDSSAVGTELEPSGARSDAPSGEPAAAPVVALPVVEEAGAPEPAPLEATGEAAAAEPAPRIVRQARHVTPAPELPAEEAASLLREEIALLDRAIRARESGEPARAVAALEEHRARFPSGRLQPERDRMLGELATAAEATTP